MWGHGYSDVVERAYTPQLLEQQLTHLLKALHIIEPLHVVRTRRLPTGFRFSRDSLLASLKRPFPRL